MEYLAIAIMLIGVSHLIHLLVMHDWGILAWLRSCKKRPEPRPQHLREITIAEQAWKDGWTEAYWSMGWNKAPSPPSSPPTPGLPQMPKR